MMTKDVVLPRKGTFGNKVPQMKSKRFRLSSSATERMKQIKGRTGFKTENIIPRIGLCLSLKENGLPNPDDYDQEGKEYNRYTLLGEWDSFYTAIIREHMNEHGLSEDEMDEYFRAHLNRGVLIAYALIKNLTDIPRLVEVSQQEQ